MKLLLVVVVFAIVMYLAIRWLQDRGTGGTPATRRPSGPPSRPVAPDDDEAFLRDLERRRRREQSKPPETPDA
ncbi:hypothetical protein JK386_14445 [Nocardioides sp. zg-536]|uniref:Uncharacterized protein n=1 Tax=Nocardioides faecalis TaxID=2803858 RepID=A0A939BZA0_9ACTN|nr:hypothetical protein [Nocardioides faecalis]MBM9461098.1 hypothetical protein [Nocardioides faecalis]MBS4751997.1 hypothetical protein [Nocardioides faecalis]QVI59177.1 hypothetical protein KG111_01985 [Nocardioides faecalis]